MKLHPKVEQVSVEMHKGIYVELYIPRGDTIIMIDTGIVPSPERDILPVLKSLGLTLSDVGLILNTHAHPDHAGGNARIKTAGSAEVYIHKEEEIFLRDHDYLFDLHLAPIYRIMDADVPMERQTFLEMAGPEITADRLLKSGDVVDGGSGFRLHVVDLPGHSPGSIGFFWEEEGILFSGDAASGLHNVGGKLPIVYDLQAYKKSLRLLQGIPIHSLACSHRYRGIHLAPVSVRQGSEVDQFLRDSLEVAERISVAIQNVSSYCNEKSFIQLVDDVIVQLPQEFNFLPIDQVDKPFLSTQAIYFQLYGIGQRDD